MSSPIPIPLLKNLRCGHCRKFVTCGPVFVTPDSSIICGRCQRFAKKIYRNVAFEALASSYRYPCHYWPKHCNAKLLWNDSLEHERLCLFQSGCNVFCSRPCTYFKSERKLPDIKDIELAPLKDETLEILKCVHCESYLSNSPVYILSTGRNICHRCSHSNGQPKESVQNLAFEIIATSFIFPCIYRFRGCPIRMKFGREMWRHEGECSYGQINKSNFTKNANAKGGKERGVIETHSGHIWGTITPHSALFAPPKTRKNDKKIVTQELTEIMRKKHHDEQGFDAQSMDSVMSKGTLDSFADNISRSTADNISRNTGDNVSKDNVWRSSPRAPSRDEDYRYSNETSLHEHHRSPGYYNEMSHLEKNRHFNGDLGSKYVAPSEVQPMPKPPGYNKISYNGYHGDNVAMSSRNSHLDQYSHLAHYPPVFTGASSSTNLQNSSSFNQGNPVRRTESARIGNPDIINELREINQLKRLNSTRADHNPYAPVRKNNSSAGMEPNNPYGQCNSVQDIVQTHGEMFK